MSNEQDLLLPDRYPQYELFICDVADAVLKDIMPQMEHPFYSLSKKPETTVKKYENNGNWVQIVPSVKGLATIYDKDILIYCISQVIAKMKNGSNISKKIRISSRDLLLFCNRGTAGKDYEALQGALERLQGTVISTNIKTGHIEQTNNFGLIESSSIKRENGNNGRLISCDIILSDWVFNAIKSKEVLTLHRDYFRLRKPVERRLYEIGRKHCGKQIEWRARLSVLLEKTGSQSPEKRFRQMIRDLARTNHLPDYRILFDADCDMVTFKNRSKEAPKLCLSDIFLDPETYAEARKVAPGADVYALESEWKFWLSENEIAPMNPDRHFLKFCQTWNTRNN